MWLKRATPQNIVIGGAAGAFPPMIGWAAATGSIGIEPVLLFLLVFFWTPPHFWALSLNRTEDYARARIPMLPVVAGAAETRRQILLYSLSLVPIGAAPWLLGYADAIYGVTALVAGGLMVALAWRLFAEGARPEGGLVRQAAVRLLDPLPLRSFRRPPGRGRGGWSPRPCDGMRARGDGRGDMDDKPVRIVLTEEQKRKRRARSIAIAVALGALVVLFYIVTLVKGPGVLNQP